MEDSLFTIKEVAKYLKIPKSTLYKLSQRKDLPSCKIGKQLRFRKSSLDKWLSEKETTALIPPPHHKKTTHILLIDDDTLVLKSISRFLTTQGYNVESAESGQEALEKVEKLNFNLIIVDIRMPGISGIETIKKIRELQSNFNRPCTPELVITGFADTDAEVQAKSLGITDYLYKPFVTVDFIKTIKQKLEAADSN